MATIRSAEKLDGQESLVPRKRVLTEAQKTAAREQVRRWRESLTPEELKAFRTRQAEARRAKIAAMNPEQKAAFNAKKAEEARLRRASFTPEQRQAASAYATEAVRRHRASLTPEQRKAENRRYVENRRQKDTYPEYRAARLEASKRFYTVLRMTALVRYGGDPAHCACCGVTHVEFLVIDHVNGGGSQHRKNLQASSIYTWLKKQGYPDGFRVLCHNCNFAIRFGDPCPHEREKILPFNRVSGGDA